MADMADMAGVSASRIVFVGVEEVPGRARQGYGSAPRGLAAFLWRCFSTVFLWCMRISPLENSQGWGDRIDALGICSRIRTIRSLA